MGWACTQTTGMLLMQQNDLQHWHPHASPLGMPMGCFPQAQSNTKPSEPPRSRAAAILSDQDLLKSGVELRGWEEKCRTHQLQTPLRSQTACRVPGSLLGSPGWSWGTRVHVCSGVCADPVPHLLQQTSDLRLSLSNRVMPVI